MSTTRRAVVLALILILDLSTAGLAQFVEKEIDSSGLDTYWTPELYQAARPYVPDRWTRGSSPQAEAPSDDIRTDFAFVAAPPTVDVAPDLNSRLFVPSPTRDVPENGAAAKDVGSAKGYFSSSRLIPLDADLFYPYRTVGKLFYTIPGVGPALCSATVIAPRLVLTAGHCVHSGKAANAFFTDFRFIPAFRDGANPYGTWTAKSVLVTTTWATGQGKVPNAADFAVLVMNDLQFSDGKLYRIGDVVGRLGVTLAALQANHVLMLGYPGSLDGGNKMHQVASASLKFDSKTNTVIYGTDMTPGSSGGPWVQNFGLPAVGQSIAGGAAALNRVVGVMSFVSTTAGVKVGGSSVPDSRLASMLNAACAEASGNC